LQKFEHKNIIQKTRQTYSLHNSEATITLDNFPFTTQLIGDFNLYNSLAAALATRTVGIDDETIKKALSTFTAPTGRQEIIYDKEFKVISDFAHTPNGFEKLLPALKKITSVRSHENLIWFASVVGEI
jgi:UDP-N-acetylmuramoyl-L-alanyl-D-glutamate--2,6-diaminopimelate ligase